LVTSFLILFSGKFCFLAHLLDLEFRLLKINYCTNINRQQIITENTKIENDIFSDLIANETVGDEFELGRCGSAIFCRGNTSASILIKKCSFNNCSCDKRGGAMLVYDLGSTHIIRSNFI